MDLVKSVECQSRMKDLYVPIVIRRYAIFAHGDAIVAQAFILILDVKRSSAWLAGPGICATRRLPEAKFGVTTHSSTIILAEIRTCPLLMRTTGKS